MIAAGEIVAGVFAARDDRLNQWRARWFQYLIRIQHQNPPARGAGQRIVAGGCKIDALKAEWKDLCAVLPCDFDCAVGGTGIGNHDFRLERTDGIQTFRKIPLLILHDHAEAERRLHVRFQAATGGRRLCQSVRFWNSTATASRLFSRKGGPTSSSPTGRPEAKPQGNEMPCRPAIFEAGMRLVIPGFAGCGRSGPSSSSESVTFGAASYRAGATIRSMFSKTSRKLRCTSDRMRIAFKYWVAVMPSFDFRPSACLESASWS